MKKQVPLCEIEPGQRGRVVQICMEGEIRRRILDIGLIQNTEVECLGRSPAGDPSAYRIRGAVIALRLEDAKNIWMEVTKEEEF